MSELALDENFELIQYLLLISIRTIQNLEFSIHFGEEFFIYIRSICISLSTSILRL